jgi:GT2 family glycosyltransferase
MISVLVVNHDAREHLRHCLERLAAEAGSWGEVIVVDNASADGSAEMVRQEFPAVRFLASEENLGFGGANNRAAAIARGEMLLLLNSDAWLAGGALERLAGKLAATPEAGAAAPELRYPDGSRQFAWAPATGVWGEAVQKLRNRFEARAWVHRPPPALLRPLFGPGWLSAACLLVRKEAFDRVGGFDERFFLYFEDVDLCRRLRLAGWRLLTVDGAVAYHVKGGSRPSRRGEVEYRRAQLYYYEKHRPRWENRYLGWRLRRKFARLEDPELRRELLALLDEG